MGDPKQHPVAYGMALGVFRNPIALSFPEHHPSSKLARSTPFSRVAPLLTFASPLRLPHHNILPFTLLSVGPQVLSVDPTETTDDLDDLLRSSDLRTSGGLRVVRAGRRKKGQRAGRG